MNSYKFGRPVEILLIEDNPDDIDLTQEALKEAKMAVRLTVIEDGVEALTYLQQLKERVEALKPDLILLDLNLPKVNGHEILSQLKANPDLKHIPVVILTTSAAEEDILRAYQQYANTYITKPVNFDKFFGVIKSIGDFWLNAAKLPPGE